MPGGGNNKLTPEREEIVLKLVSEGKLLKDIAKAAGVEVATISQWRMRNSAFENRYAHAQSIGFEVQADSLLEITEQEQDVNKARLKSDNLKWILARRAASRYGDRIDVNVHQTVDIGGALSEARRRVILPCDIQETIDTEIIDTSRQIEHNATDSLSVDEDKILSVSEAEKLMADELG
jgi:transposase